MTRTSSLGRRGQSALRLLSVLAICFAVVWGLRSRASAWTPDDEFSVEMNLRFSDQLSANPETTDWMPPIKLSFERKRVSGGLVDRLSVVAPPSGAPRVEGALSQYLSRLEVGVDGDAHVFDASGRELPWPDLSQAQGLLGQELSAHSPADVSAEARKLEDFHRQFDGPRRPTRASAVRPNGLIALLAGADQRDRKIRAALGQPSGRVRGMDRFVKTEGEVVKEVLVDPSIRMPLEINTVESGRLVRHVRRSYQLDAVGRVLLYSTHVEQDTLKPGDHRLAIDTTYTSYRIGAR